MIARNSFGAAVREARVGAGMSQSQLAAILGVSPIHVGYFERGLRHASVKLLCQICQALGLDVRAMLTFEHPEFAGSEGRPQTDAWRVFARSGRYRRRYLPTAQELKVLKLIHDQLGPVSKPLYLAFVLLSIRQALDGGWV